MASWPIPYSSSRPSLAVILRDIEHQLMWKGALET